MKIRQGKEIKDIQTANKEEEPSLFAGSMIYYVKNLMKSTKKTLELINECSNVAGYKNTHIYTNQLYFYILATNGPK